MKEERAEADLLVVEQAPDDASQALVVAAASEAAQNAEADAQLPWLVDVEHDRETRKHMIAEMVADRHVYSDEEDSIIQRGLAMLESDSARLCFPVIPTESSAASVRTFKLHDVNLVLCSPLLHLPHLPVLVHINDVRELSAHVVAITCFAMENA